MGAANTANDFYTRVIGFLKCFIIKSIIVITCTTYVHHNFYTLFVIFIPRNFPIIPGHREFAQLFRNIPWFFSSPIMLEITLA